jgi:hypothetical protein
LIKLGTDFQGQSQWQKDFLRKKKNKKFLEIFGPQVNRILWVWIDGALTNDRTTFG